MLSTGEGSLSIRDWREFACDGLIKREQREVEGDIAILTRKDHDNKMMMVMIIIAYKQYFYGRKYAENDVKPFNYQTHPIRHKKYIMFVISCNLVLVYYFFQLGQ